MFLVVSSSPIRRKMLLGEALDVDRGTFYNHILRNKKSNTWYAKQRELLRVAIQNISNKIQIGKGIKEGNRRLH